MTEKKLSHYLIVEQIGAGGMGVVYRARDEILKREVALKVLPAEMLADDSARNRFHKEALALARLNHPNIATVHELGQHEGIDFLVTEYIPGITLDDKIASGPLPLNQVAGLGFQLAQGLRAAHEQGVLHRDLKPSNLRLTPDGRLKILDFGLARAISRSGEMDPAATLTQSQALIGTLPYMAPEHLRGDSTDARSDIWAAGAVLYEMATGKRPFPETNTALLINAILNGEPQAPSKINPAVPPSLEILILKALAREPSRRYQTAQQLGMDLERLASGISPPGELTKRRMIALPAAWSLLAVLVVALGGYYFHARNESRRPPESVAVTARPSVAILGFKNLAEKPEWEWLSTALSEMLATELAAGGQLRIVPGESVAQTKISLSLQETDSYSKETLAKLRQNLGADHIVLGSYLLMGSEQIRLDLRLQNALAGETVAFASERGSAARLDELAAKAGATLRTQMGAGGLSESQHAEVRASRPSYLEAAQFYAQGLAKLRIFDSLGARDLLQKAVALEPDFSLSHDALARAWKELGYDQKAREESQKAFELSASLPREERLSVEARYREAINEWDKAAAIYGTLFNFFPDNLDYGLRLAKAQTSAGNAQEAYKTLETLLLLPPPERYDLRIGLAEVDAADSLGDYTREQRAARSVAERAAAQGAKLLLAEALYNEAWALQNLGELEKAGDAALLANQIYHAMGNHFGAAKALTVSGTVLLTKGDLTGAAQAYQNSLAIARMIGNKGREAVCLNQLANISSQQGKLADARKLFEGALAIFSELGNKGNAARVMNNIAGVLHSEGNLPGAARLYRNSQVLSQQIGDKDNVGAVLLNLANIYAEQGDLAGAEKTYGDSLDIFKQTGSKSDKAYVLAGLGTLFSIKGELAEAQRNHAEALFLRREIGEQVTAAESKLALAELYLEEDRAENADIFLREALKVFVEKQIRDGELKTHLIRARFFLTGKEIGMAQKEISLAGELLKETQAVAIQLNFALASARVRAASGSPADLNAARTMLLAITDRARQIGLIGDGFEARLLLGEIEMKLRNPDAGRERLIALRKDATAKGFLLIARKAAASAASP